MVGSPVYLTLNLYVSAGLFNSAKGKVVDIIYGTTTATLPPNLPEIILVKFDKLKIRGFNGEEGVVPIPPISI